MDVLLFLLVLAIIQFSITIAVATFDIIVVWFGVWIPMRRATAPEDRPYLWRGIAGYAKKERELAELQARVEATRKR